MLGLPKRIVCALEAVVDIALHSQQNCVTCAQLTQRQKIAKRYLERILQDLVRAGILAGQRGPSGGYNLARERRNISVGSIVRALDEQQPSKKKSAASTSAAGTSAASTSAAGTSAVLPPSSLGAQIIEPLCKKLAGDRLATLDEITIENLVKKAKKNGIIKTESKTPSDFNI